MMPKKVLILCDYDDTIFRTDDFLARVLTALGQLGQSDLAAEISRDVATARAELGTSADYKIGAKLAPFADELARILAPNNAALIWSDAQTFARTLPSAARLTIFTRGDEIYQRLKFAGTMFEKSTKFSHEIFSEKDKIAKFLRDVTIGKSLYANNFYYNKNFYNQLIFIDNDARYFTGFDRLKRAGIDARGILLHRRNPRFMPRETLPGGVEIVVDFSEIKI